MLRLTTVLLVLLLATLGDARADDGMARGLGIEPPSTAPVTIVDAGEMTAAQAQSENDARLLRNALRALRPSSGTAPRALGSMNTVDQDAVVAGLEVLHRYGAFEGMALPTDPGAKRAMAQSMGDQRAAMRATASALDARAAASAMAVGAARAAGAMTASNEEALVNPLRRLGFSLRENPDIPGNTHPAVFSYFRNFETGKDVLAAKFALLWASPKPLMRGKTFSLSGTASFSGNLTTDETAQVNDAWQIRGGVRATWNFAPDAPVGRKTNIWVGRLDGKYEQSQDSDTQKISAVFGVEPKIGRLALGVRRGFEYGVDGKGVCIRPRNMFSWQWQPTVEVDVGETMDRGASEEKESTILRGRFDISGTLYFDGLARTFYSQHYVYDSESLPKLRIGNSFFYHPLEDTETHNYFFADLKIPLNKLLSISVTYANGEKAPDFKKVETLLVGLGVQF